MNLEESALQDFLSRLRGAVLSPGDLGFDEARAVHNAMIDRRPALIVRCTDAGDVVAAVNLARQAGLGVAVRSGGHAVAGTSVCEGGLVIDLRPMKQIAVDPALQVARVGGGVTWGELDAATQEFGLATTGGRVSTTGVSGLTLGGGSGWLERKHGLACDNLVSVEMVTADGRIITASATEHSDLFWALHGGGGNFGVITALEFRLRPVGPTVLAGLLLWPGEAGADVFRFHRDFAATAPDELGSAAAFITATPEEFVPPSLRGRICGAVALCYSNPPEEGEEVLGELRGFGPPAADLVQPMPYVDFQRLLDQGNAPGFRNHWTAEYLDDLSDEAIDVFVAHALETKSPWTQSLLFHWGGAVARSGEDESPLAHRDAAWVAHPLAMWEEPVEDDLHIAWARDFAADMKRFASGGVYLNFIGDEGEGRIRAAYGKHYARLAGVKAEYDPENLFRSNQNIEPEENGTGA